MGRKKGKVDVSQIVEPPSKGELITTSFLAQKGFDIEFLRPNRAKGSRTPDIFMAGKNWEIKCPLGQSSRTIENNLRLALKQSPYIIINLHKCKLIDEKAIHEIETKFRKLKKIREIIVITKARKMLDFKK